jgi:1-acyl-sn-glycerol-3-phosphate acyltransferase
MVFSLSYRIRIEREIGVVTPSPAIILPKHQYWTDIPLMSIAIPESLYFVAKKELFLLPGVRTFLSLLGGIPLDRDRSIRTLKSFKQIFSLLDRAERVVLFPEGTYVRHAVGLGKSRLIEMILEYQSRRPQRIPFIPVGIRYGKRMGGRREVRIRIGRPLFGNERTDAPSLTGWVMKEISRLSGLPMIKGSSPSRRTVQNVDSSSAIQALNGQPEACSLDLTQEPSIHF